jgi:hypothetical protein
MSATLAVFSDFREAIGAGRMIRFCEARVAAGPFNRRDNARMQHTSLPLQKTIIGHVMGERMCEGIGQLWIQTRLDQELRLLQVRETPTQVVFGHLSESLQEGERYLPANHGSALEEPLLFWRQPIDAGRQDRLYGGWHLHTRQGLGQVVGAPLAAQYLRLH